MRATALYPEFISPRLDLLNIGAIGNQRVFRRDFVLLGIMFASTAEAVLVLPSRSVTAAIRGHLLPAIRRPPATKVTERFNRGR